jgi:GNAT superfamily N-acetyltransferase
LVNLSGLAIAFSKANAPFMNMCVLVEPSACLNDLRDRAEAACGYAKSAGVPWLFVACEPALPEGADAVLCEAGLLRAVDLAGMSAEILAPPRKRLPVLRFERVTESGAAGLLAAINAAAYGLPAEAAPAMTAPALWDKDCFSYLGFLRDQAVTCSATTPIDGQLYVAWVATLPEHCGKGYAEAVMRHSIGEAARATGLRRIHLHASIAGRPLYERMGFQTSVSFSLFYHHATS